MATKGDRLFSKDKNNSFGNASSQADSDSQYFNVNLNQNHNCSVMSSSHINHKTASEFNKFTVPDYDEGKQRSQSLKKSSSMTDLCSKFNDFVIVNNGEPENDKKREKKRRSSSINNSTLSLHISGYENSIEASSSNSCIDTGISGASKPGLIKKPVAQIPFPRSPNENSISGPELMEFRRSKKLLQPQEYPMSKFLQRDYHKAKENADALFKATRYGEAVEVYSSILAFCEMSSPEKAVIHSNRCACYLKMLWQKHALKKAKKDAENAIKYNPYWWKGHFRLALCHKELEKWEESKKSLLTALDLNGNSELLYDHLQIVEKEIFKSSLSYPQRIKLHQLFDDYRNTPAEINEDSSFTESEVKRSGEFGEFDEYYANLYGDSNDDSLNSLISDKAEENNSVGDKATLAPTSKSPEEIPSNGSDVEVITLESSSEDIAENEGDKNIFVKIDKIDSTQLLKQVYGYDNSHQGYTIQSSVPDLPPNEKGIHICIINGDHIANLTDLRDDRLGPWNIGKNKYSIDKIGLFKKDESYEAVTRKTEGAEKVARLCRMTHPSLKIKKRIYWDFNDDNKDTPVAGTFVVIQYEVEETYELTAEQKVKNRRLSKAASSKLDGVIIGRTGKEANEKFYANGGMINTDKTCLPSITQIRNKMAYSKKWEPTTKRGRPKNEDYEEFRRIIDARYIVRSHYVGDDISEERLMLATKAHMHLLKNVLPKKKMVQKFVDLTEQLLQYPESQRMQKAKELIESDLFKKYKEAAICSLDVTFNLSPTFHVSMLLCSCQHIRNDKGAPYVFIPAVLLSKTHKKADFEWFGSELEKQIGTDVCCRAYMTDAERSLEGMLQCSAFKPPCTKLNCNIHNKENFKEYCEGDVEIMRDIFGVNEGPNHVMGLIDEMEFPKFYDKITLLATSPKWSQHEKLQSFVASESRLRYFFDRNNLKARIAGGFGFKQATDNIGECMNMLIKSKPEFKDNMPIQDLIKELQKVMVGQLADISRVYVHKAPCQLYDQEKFLGDTAWSKLSEEEIRELLKDIYIIDSDLLPGFESRAVFPVSIAANISEEQRNNMILTAKTYKVFEVEPGSFIVKKGDDLKNIDSNTVPITCKCKLANGKQIVCHHILAVQEKFPASNILQKIEDYLETETVNQRNKRLIGRDDAAKPGKRRHVRRRGLNNSRQLNYEPVTDYLNLQPHVDFSLVQQKDVDYDPPPKRIKKTPSKSQDSEIICLDSSPTAQKTRLPQIQNPKVIYSVKEGGQPTSSGIRRPIAAVPPYRLTQGNRLPLPLPRQQFAIIRPQQPSQIVNQAFIQNQTAPPRVFIPRLPAAVMIRQQRPANPVPVNPVQPLLVSEDRVRKVIDKYYRENPTVVIPEYLSYKPFVITKIKTLSGWKSRVCANMGCRANLGDDPEKVVVSHVEPYSFMDPQTHTTKRTIGARAVCATMLCINRRYPFITKECFNSELTAEATKTILENIVRN